MWLAAMISPSGATSCSVLKVEHLEMTVKLLGRGHLAVAKHRPWRSRPVCSAPSFGDSVAIGEPDLAPWWLTDVIVAWLLAPPGWPCSSTFTDSS
jgi:hypothetical protein